LALDRYLEEYLSSEQLDCWLRFESGRPIALIGIGPGDAAVDMEVEISSTDYSATGGILSEEQCLDVEKQAEGMRKFSIDLLEEGIRLERLAHTFRHITYQSSAAKLHVVTDDDTR